MQYTFSLHFSATDDIPTHAICSLKDLTTVITYRLPSLPFNV